MGCGTTDYSFLGEVFGDVVGECYGELPPVDLAEDLGEQGSQTGGQDAVFSGLSELDGLGGLTEGFLGFEAAGAHNGYEAFVALEGAFEGCEAEAAYSKKPALELSATQAVREPMRKGGGFVEGTGPGGDVR